MKFERKFLDAFTQKMRRNSILKGYFFKKSCNKHFQNKAFQQIKFNFGIIIFLIIYNLIIQQHIVILLN